MADINQHAPPAVAAPPRLATRQRPIGAIPWGLAGLVVGVALTLGAFPTAPPGVPSASVAAGSASRATDDRSGEDEGRVRLDLDTQEAIGLATAPATNGAVHAVVRAHGRVVPDETQYAYISPRAAGVVRTVDARVGQQVAKGDLLATIDSHEVAEARLALIGGLQKWEIARARAGWQSRTYEATCELLAMLKAGAAPGEVHEGLADRAVGQNLERLITAYADFLRSDAKYARSVGLHGEGAVSLEAYQRAEADYHAAKATYKALTDSVAFQARLDHDAALLELQQAETAVNVARERLRVLGVHPDGDDRPGVPGVRVACDGPAPDAEDGEVAADPGEAPTLGTYAILAPFDGTILDRERVVPGVHVDRTHRVFTIADLSTVYVEVMVHEAALGELADRGPGALRFTTPAYPDAVFEGRVLYSGDLVDERTRAVELLAEADNPGRRLKPGMFVDVEVISPRTRPAVLVPRSALLSDDGESFVYVRTGPEDFERRPVVPGRREGDRRAVDGGIEPGDEVVVRGAFKLKATATTGGE